MFIAVYTIRSVWTLGDVIAALPSSNTLKIIAHIHFILGLPGVNMHVCL